MLCSNFNYISYFLEKQSVLFVQHQLIIVKCDISVNDERISLVSQRAIRHSHSSEANGIDSIVNANLP